MATNMAISLLPVVAVFLLQLPQNPSKFTCGVYMKIRKSVQSLDSVSSDAKSINISIFLFASCLLCRIAICGDEIHI